MASSVRARGWLSTAAATAALALGSAVGADAQALSRGTVLDDVKCAADASQSYALYLPSTYSPDRAWSVLMGFHPAARGRAIVDLYKAAAERYGYIVAASNTSRNGPWSASAAAVKAMSGDLATRFSIDAQRVYLTGHSGGARLAMQVALDSKQIAGVIASSAGFADTRSRSSVPFAVFGTAGIDDFNYNEMRLLDRKLTSPHFLAVFNGGHQLPPEPVALEAIEWMELQAMKADRRPRDEALVEALAEKRRRAVAEAASPTASFHAMEAFVADFKGLRDVSAASVRLAQLAADPDLKKALARERADDDEEARFIREVVDLETALQDPDRRSQALARLRNRLSQWARAAQSPVDSPERIRARRALRTLMMGAGQRVGDEEYRKMLDEFYRQTQGK
jgi:dienelactone hydrolase